VSSPPTSDATSIALDVVPRLARLVTRVLDTEVPDAVTLRQYRVLTRLATGGQEDVGALAARSGVRRPAMSQTVDGLVERGWVTRTEDPQDRRRRSVAITPTGRDVLEGAGAALHEHLASLLRGISDQERDALHRGLAALGRELDRRWHQMVAQSDG
jgi:DNA-binding MarR family transcriptional regulator